MKAGDIAALMTAGLTPPSGPEDVAFHTGQIVTWDDLSGVNTVTVSGVVLSNLKVVQSGIGLSYTAGDVVVIMRKQTQFFVLGKVGSPGVGAANQIQSAEVSTYETTGSTSYTDLTTSGPQVTATIGSSRRCLVLFGAHITVAGNSNGNYLGGTMTFYVSGASSIIPAVGGTGVTSAMLDTGSGVGLSETLTSSKLLTASDGLNAGVNTFTAKYLSNISSPVAGFRRRTLTVIPF